MKIFTQFFSNVKFAVSGIPVLLGAALVAPQYGFAQTRIIVNPGLEFGVNAGAFSQLDTNFGSGATFDAGAEVTSPWYTSHPVQSGVCAPGSSGACHPVEVWGTGYNNVPAAQGTNFVELNAYTSSMIYQNMYLTNGDEINYYFRHRARGNDAEQSAMVIEDENEVNIATVHTTSLPSSTGSWSINQGTYVFNGTTGVYRVGFRAINSANPGFGNLLDDIRVSLNPIIDLNFSNALASCEGSSNGYVFMRISGAVIEPTTVALELVDPANGSPFVSDNDIVLSGVSTINGTPSVSHVPGTSIYLVTVPPGNYDGGITPGFSSPNNDIDGIAINVTSVNDGVDEPTETFRFEIKEQGTNGSTDNFMSTTSPVFGDTYYPSTNDYFIQRCICYDDANTSAPGIDSKMGITLLGRAGSNGGNWPMLRKSAYTVLESNTKGFVITRMTTVQINAITDPQDGMMVYDTTSKCMKIYDGYAWYCFNTPTCP
ncbi:hypothetical protein [Chryseobacterium sp. Leaf201]|uniref:hypothetical protein n=1 Tax=Chryseobacterium sp. Leaf201 TaxID=1735672 RepID=UPI0006F9CF4B|nr:hypothetical protein [Chryseobacterium sp. Leaf201]KQM41805.1 hypothetical protein ASE55_13635 [Chryseobacterium sp. Leaf201]